MNNRQMKNSDNINIKIITYDDDSNKDKNTDHLNHQS